ncbi:MAG: hypothetical protein ACXAD7_16155 [Candidatus Kariarchaeaceae archaeon]|jgi:hypothetical protein
MFSLNYPILATVQDYKLKYDGKITVTIQAGHQPGIEKESKSTN